MTDKEYMRRAIELAGKGGRKVHPNPQVGAVIVKDGTVIGEGFHECCGMAHAERNALSALTQDAAGADMYVTLEPCCHYGKQPPCTEAIIAAGIKKVVIGSRDPNPKVAGKGVRLLREAGIEVVEDFLRDECDRLNPVFFHYITTGMPYVKMKYAMTADGKIATRTGESRWISGEGSRRRVHEWRQECMGIMAGIGTVLQDDPELTCRIEGGIDPVRIICDSHLRIPEDSRIVRSAGRVRTIIACTAEAADGGDHVHGLAEDAGKDISKKTEMLRSVGAEVLCFPGCPEVPLGRLMLKLGEMGIDSILLEGGGTLNESALRAGIVNEIDVFMAPKIFGGCAPTPVRGQGVELPDEAYLLDMIDTEIIEGDVLVRYAVRAARERTSDSALDERSQSAK